MFSEVEVPAGPVARPGPRRRGFSATVEIRMRIGCGARALVERILRREALRVETDALLPSTDGQCAARYQVLFAARHRRDQFVTQLLEEARPFVTAATLT